MNRPGRSRRIASVRKALLFRIAIGKIAHVVSSEPTRESIIRTSYPRGGLLNTPIWLGNNGKPPPQYPKDGKTAARRLT